MGSTFTNNNNVNKQYVLHAFFQALIESYLLSSSYR